MLDDLELQQVKDISDEARRGAVHDIQVISATIPPTITQQRRTQYKVMHTNMHHFPAARPEALIFPYKKCYAFASSAAAS